MTRKMQLAGGRQPIAPVVAAAAYDKRVPLGIALEHCRGQAQGSPLHEHSSGDPDFGDGPAVEFLHLLGSEGTGPLGQASQP
jgi:hypothetical protein